MTDLHLFHTVSDVEWSGSWPLLSFLSFMLTHCLSWFPGTSACSPCAGPGAPDRLHAGCSTPPRTEADAGWVTYELAKEGPEPGTDLDTSVHSLQRLDLVFTSVSSHRRTFVPTHPNHAFKFGWKDYGNAVGDRQLRAATHARVPRVSPLQGEPVGPRTLWLKLRGRMIDSLGPLGVAERTGYCSVGIWESDHQEKGWRGTPSLSLTT